MLNPFSYSEKEREKIVKEQKRQIKSVYKEASDEIKKEVEKLKEKNNVSANERRNYLKSLQKEINSYMKNVDTKTETIINGNVDKMISIVFENNNQFVNSLGFNFDITNTVIKKEMVNRIMSGSLYQGKWNLNKAIWGDNKAKQIEISKIISKGILKNKGLYDISKDLERYVNPNARKSYSWSNMFPGSRKKVDYNAQRLARTTISHAYQESFVRATINNPFIDAYRWITSGGHNVCTLCLDRETVDHYGLGPGIYPKDKLPLDHPNGMCTFESIISMSDEEIIDAVADWYLEEGDEDMNKRIEKFVNDLKNF